MTTEIYRVKSGESISVIARDILGDMQRWPEIAFVNGLSHPYFIYPGQILQLPSIKGTEVVEVLNDASASPMIDEQNAPIGKRGVNSPSPATVLLLAVGAFLLLRN